MTDDPGAERRRLTAEANQLKARALELRAAGRDEEAFPLWDRITEINRWYRRMLPAVTVARSPDTGEVVQWPLDTYGLDGKFWAYDATIRRLPTSVPPTWLAMAGAMRLADPVEDTPFTAVPGPGVPFVVPRILAAPGVRAVLAEVPVGRHTGWTISYFGPEPEGVPLINLWGTHDYPVYVPGEPRGWATAAADVADYDFELAGWLESGKLLWLEPGDESASLREGADGCPFLDLPGERLIAVVTNGSVRRVEALG
ncbi:hypothetical protein [Amycolatopsis vancoresmycina]|uniref:Uncharacterized protein n=1 Tax=Amycolatopsis vancoresmycina DSM 44592 TaxID=1292037 RepID=R1I8Y4_9PSEU|nr:hypothetical protein [Amycolatopsis vancoresmycina]EOD68971.1 hypothetical protein H480_08588 [Amycolatopsis vancoresmycina DSM 44592]